MGLDGNSVGIDYSEYFNTSVEYVAYKGKSDRYNTDSWEDPIYIRVRPSGSQSVFLSESGERMVSQFNYKSDVKFRVKDKINGQLVRFSKPVVEFDGTVSMYKALM